MRKYLSTLHTRDDSHKKKFALLVSGTFTLAIFLVWAVANWHPATTEDKNGNTITSSAPSPLQSMASGVAAAFASIRSNFQDAQKGLEAVDTTNGR